MKSSASLIDAALGLGASSYFIYSNTFSYSFSCSCSFSLDSSLISGMLDDLSIISSVLLWDYSISDFVVSSSFVALSTFSSWSCFCLPEALRLMEEFLTVVTSEFYLDGSKFSTVILDLIIFLWCERLDDLLSFLIPSNSKSWLPPFLRQWQELFPMGVCF